MERKLAAILSADVQGYSRLMGDDEEATIRTLTTYREVMSQLIQQHHGRVVDSPGDNLLAEFASVVDAVQGALVIQKELKIRNADLPPNREMHYRIGINVGDVVVEGERIYGDGVNIAARLESLAEGGGICISGNVYEQVENKLDVACTYRGEQTVKNIAKPVRVYKIEPEAASVSDRSGAVPAPVPPHPTLPLPDKPSIAVLPFTNMSNDPEQEYFSDGMADDIITDLSKISGLFVIARNSTFTYKGRTVDVNEVGRKLGVHHVLEGSVRKAGNRVRINVQLIDATTGGHVWAERYDRELEDIFVLQDEITQKIVFALKVTLSPTEQARFRQAPTGNLEAYDAYLRGEAYYWQYTQAALAQARQQLERAIALDPDYAAAYAVLARTYIVEWAALWSRSPETLERAFEMAQQAVGLDDALPWARLALSNVYLWQKQHEQAIAEAERVTALDPNCADGYMTRGAILHYAGLSEAAVGLIEQAMRLNPHYPFLYSFYLGSAQYGAGQFEMAIEALKNALGRQSHFHPAHAYLAASYDALGRKEEAAEEVVALVRLNPQISVTHLRQLLPYQDPARLEHFLSALRKAGLK